MRFAFLLLFGPACTSVVQTVTEPAGIVELHGIVVRAQDVQEAERMASQFADLDRKVRDMLLAVEPRSPEFWLLDVEIKGPANGVALLDPPAVCLEVGHHESLHLAAHELAHYYHRLGPSRLPPLVEEGLAELVGASVRGQLETLRGRYAQILRHTRVENIENLLRVTNEDLWSVSESRALQAFRSVGFAIADQIGLEGLREMCVRASEREQKVVPRSCFVPFWAEISHQSYSGSGVTAGVDIVTFR